MMETPKKKNKLSNHSLVLISVIAAVLIWFIVGTFINPTDTRYISGIPVQIEDSSVLKALGLSVVEGSSQTITVQVSGPKLTISSLSPSDFTALPRYSAISAPGVYTLDVDVMISSNASGVTIEDHSPHTVSVRLARLDEKTLDIGYEIQTQIPDGYVLNDVTISEASVNVVGEQSILDSIESAKVLIYSFDETIQSLPINLLDKDGNIIDTSSLTLSLSQAQVTTTLNRTKVVNLIATIDDAADYNIQGTVTRTVTPSSITVSAAEDVIDSISDSYVIDTISMSDVSGNLEKTIELKLPSGAKVIDGTDSVTVQTTVQGATAIQVDVPTIVIDSSLSAYNITVNTQKLSVTVMGPTGSIATLLPENFTATVIYTAGQTPPTGQYSMPVKIVSSSPDVWAIGEYSVTVTVA